MWHMGGCKRGRRGARCRREAPGRKRIRSRSRDLHAVLKVQVRTRMSPRLPVKTFPVSPDSSEDPAGGIGAGSQSVPGDTPTNTYWPGLPRIHTCINDPSSMLMPGTRARCLQCAAPRRPTCRDLGETRVPRLSASVGVASWGICRVALSGVLSLVPIPFIPPDPGQTQMLECLHVKSAGLARWGVSEYPPWQVDWVLARDTRPGGIHVAIDMTRHHGYKRSVEGRVLFMTNTT